MIIRKWENSRNTGLYPNTHNSWSSEPSIRGMRREVAIKSLNFFWNRGPRTMGLFLLKRASKNWVINFTWILFHGLGGIKAGSMDILLVFELNHSVYEDYAKLTLDYLTTSQNFHMSVVGDGSFKLIYTSSSVAVPPNDSDDVYQSLCSALSDKRYAGKLPDLILDLTHTPLTSGTVKSLAKNLEIPSVSLFCCAKSETIQDVFSETDYLFHMVFEPPAKSWFSSIRYFVEREQIPSAAIVMDSSFELDNSHTSILSNLPCRHLLKRLDFNDPEEVLNFTTNVKQIGFQSFFIVSSALNAGRLLEEAYTLDMFVPGRPPSFFVLTKDFDHVPCKQCSEGNFVKLKPIYWNTTLRDEVLAHLQQNPRDGTALTQLADYREVDLLYLYDGIRAVVSALLASEIFPVMPSPLGGLSCDNMYRSGTNLKQTAESITGLNREKFGLGQNGNTYRGRNFEWIFRQTNLTGALGPVVPGTQKNNTVIKTKLDVKEQSIYYETTNITNHIGTWSIDDGLQEAHERIPRALTNKRIRVAILLETPFIMKNDNTSDVPYSGYLIDLIQKISNELQFEYELYEVPDKQFGAIDNNGEWNGLVRELIDKKAEIGLAPLSVMAERENVVDFTVPYFDLVGVRILMKKTYQEQSLFKFVTVLEPPVWASIFGAYILTSLLMFAFDRFSPHSYRNIRLKELAKKDSPIGTKSKDTEKVATVDLDANGEYGTRIFSLKECLWFCMTSLTPQGGGEAPRNLSGRLLAATWWMFGFIIIASYTANLAAFLTVSRLETQVASLDDLTKQYGIRYAPVENSATEVYFKRMWRIEEKFYEIWRDMSLNESMSDQERAELAVWDYPVSDKYTKLWLTMKDFARPQTVDEGVAWVKATNVTAAGDKDGFALIGDSAILQYKANLDCDLVLTGEEFSRKPYALAVQEGSALRDQLSGVILKLLNQRELEMMKEEWWQTKNQKACASSDDENEGISIENIGGVFILVLAGTVLAAIMLSFEYYYYRRQEAKKLQQIKQTIEMTSSAVSSKYETDYKTNYNTNFHSDYNFAPTMAFNPPYSLPYNRGSKPSKKLDKVTFESKTTMARDNHGFEFDQKQKNMQGKNDRRGSYVEERTKI